MLHFLTKALKSPNLVTGLLFGISGLAFAAANIILASVQTIDDYALFALIVSVLTLFSNIGLFGIDGIVNRHRIAPNVQLFRRVLSTGLLAAIIAALVLINYYSVGILTILLIITATVGQTIIGFAAAYFQSHHDFRPSLIAINSLNFVFLIVALVAKINNWQGAVAPLVLMTSLLVLGAIVFTINVRQKYKDVQSDYTYSWREALAYISITSSASVLIQLERLLTPQLLELKDLATLGVSLAIVAPPFRLLQITLGYVLLPKLRAAGSLAETKSMILQEIGIALLLLVPSWILVWYAVPIIDSYFFGDKYQLSAELVLSLIFAGTAKALSGIARASVAALASDSQLNAMGIAGWVGVVLSVVGAYYGASFGIAGIVYGVSVGWIIRLAIAVVLVRKNLATVPQSESAKS